LPGFPLRTDAKIIRYPDRYMDERGRSMWETVLPLLDELAEEEGRVSPAIPEGCHA
jgi:DNA polymerase-1